MKKRNLLLLLMAGFSSSSLAEFTDSCQLYAQMLASSASTYSMANSTFKMQESNYESACNRSYGYSRDDVSACGEYGYVISAYNNALEQLKSSKREFDSDLSNVSLFCGLPETINQIYHDQQREFESTVAQLQNKTKALQAEIAELKRKVNP